jgi:succinoglycan biosynthesis transport protein ExoP
MTELPESRSNHQPDPEQAPAAVSRAASYPPLLVPMPSGYEEVHLRDYWRVLLRYRWTAVGFFLVVVAAAGLWISAARPTYTATATLQLQNLGPKVVVFDGRGQGPSAQGYSVSQETYLETQLRLLQSRTLAERVIERLALEGHPEFQASPERPGWLAGVVGAVRDVFADTFGDETAWPARSWAWLEERVGGWWPARSGGAGGPGAALTGNEPHESPLFKAFQERLSVTAVPDAYLVQVAFTSQSPALSAKVANTLVDVFLRQEIDQKVGASQFASQFLTRELQEVQQKLEASERKLNAFLKANDIMFLTPGGASLSSGGPDGGELITQQLKVLSDRLLQARTERIARESLFRQAVSRDSASLPPVLESDLVRSLKGELAKLEAEARQLAKFFKPGYPRLEQLGLSIAEVRSQLAAETERIVNGIETDYRAAHLNERRLQQELDQHRDLVRRLGDKMVAYTLLRRDVDTNRELYTTLLTRLKETGVTSGLTASSFTIVDSAVAPTRPSAPRKKLILLLASFVGLVGGVGLAFLREYIDTSIRTVKDIENTLRVPALGVIPSRKSLPEGPRRRAVHERTEAPFGLVAHLRASSVVAEAFRQLRASLLYSPEGGTPKVLMVTSLQAGDGKTSLAANLAIVLAQLDAGDVLLVDADMRRPSVHTLLGVSQAPGLAEYLIGQAQATDAVRLTHVPRLSVLPAGDLPHNPAELLSSPRLRQALGDLSKVFSYVVIDSTPLFGASDAAVLAPKVEGVVLVLRHRKADREAARRAVGRLMSVGGRVLGVVLNDVDVTAAGADASQYGPYAYYGYTPDARRRPND